ncbi:MAG: YbhB/YbcL family Raf kinase inhibitor-like protein [Candidatus Omnitrophota bacterium]
MVTKSVIISILILISIFLISSFCLADINEGSGTMNIKSPDFDHNGLIPKRYTGQGEDINPALLIDGIPSNAKSLALIVDDPDTPMGTWVHWVVFNIPIIAEIRENTIPGKQGINDFGKKNYGGPMPPSGTHRYFFKIYALDIMLDLEEGISKSALEKAMEGHVIATAELVGRYKKQ